MEPDLGEAAEQGGTKAADADTAGRLTYEIFSLLESKFLFGRAAAFPSAKGKVCVLSIDGGARASDGLLAAAALVRLESALRRRAGIPSARLADFFDAVAGSGSGGVLAALLFARGGGRPLHSAEEALGFLLRGLSSRRRGWWWAGAALGDLTFRDTVRPLLVPCYDLATRAPLLFSRAAAAGCPARHDFRLRDVCAATCAAGPRAVEVASVDGATRVRAVAAAMRNPTAAAITHVLNNPREFPAAAAVGDLLVVSIGTGEAAQAAGRRRRSSRANEVARIAADGVSEMVDQAVAMAFGQSRASNYIRIQGTAAAAASRRAPRACGGETAQQAVWKAEAMLQQRSVESVLFQGRKMAGETNAEKLERLARDLAREHARRKQQQPQQASPGEEAPPVASAAAAPPPPPKQQPTKARPQKDYSARTAAAAPEPAVVPPRRRRAVSGAR